VKPLGITQEEYLFGGANGKAGQSAFLMRFIEKTKGKGNSDFYKDKSFEIEFLLRPHLKQGKKPDPDWRGLLASIWLLGHFGGVGAKVRRGYGTIALEKWEAKNCEKLQSMIDNDFPILHNAKSLEDWEEEAFPNRIRFSVQKIIGNRSGVSGSSGAPTGRLRIIICMPSHTLVRTGIWKSWWSLRNG
jgi:hypothetical protein